MTLMPGRSARKASTRAQNCRRDSGSTPVVGSSRMSRSGSCTSAQHKPSFCFMPPDSLPAGRSRKGLRPVASIRRCRRAARSRAPWPNSRAKKSMFSATDSVGYKLRPKPCGMKATRGASTARSRAWAMSWPSTRTPPRCRRLTPAISDSSVDLPTPSGPTRPMVCPAGKLSEMWCSAVTSPYRWLTSWSTTAGAMRFTAWPAMPWRRPKQQARLQRSSQATSPEGTRARACARRCAHGHARSARP